MRSLSEPVVSPGERSIRCFCCAGILAPESDLDKILMTVVNNLLVLTNRLPRPVRTRVLLTAPLETFSVEIPSSSAAGWWMCFPTRPALRLCFHMNGAHCARTHWQQFGSTIGCCFDESHTEPRLQALRKKKRGGQEAVDLLKSSPMHKSWTP